MVGTSLTSFLEPGPDWQPPAVLCAVVGSARSGSTYLRDLMLNTGELGRPQEYFNTALWQPAGYEPSVRWSCKLVATHGTTENRVAAVKIFPYQFRWVQQQIRLADWFPAVRWVWLQRKDILGQAISAEIATQTNSWHRSEQIQGDPAFSVAAIDAQLTRIMAETASWTAFFLRSQVEPLLVEYESLCADPSAEVHRIARHVGIELSGDLDPRTRTTLQRNAIGDEWRRRYLAESSALTLPDFTIVDRGRSTRENVATAGT